MVDLFKGYALQISVTEENKWNLKLDDDDFFIGSGFV